jgi:hypothetical protein
LTEPVSEYTGPEVYDEPADISDAELARLNMQWGWALFGLFILLFAGTVGVAFAYLWLD